MSVFTRHFFVEGKFYGSAELRPVWWPKVLRPVPPRGRFFFCAACSRMWAECPVDDQPGHIHELPCQNHKSTDIVGGYGPERVGLYSIPSYAPAGSLFLPYEADFPLETFPAVLLQRELLLHLHWFEQVRKDNVSQAVVQFLTALINGGQK